MYEELCKRLREIYTTGPANEAALAIEMLEERVKHLEKMVQLRSPYLTTPVLYSSNTDLPRYWRRIAYD